MRTLDKDVSRTLAVTVAVVAVVVGGLAYWFSQSFEAEALRDHGRQMAERLAHVVALPMWNLDQQGSAMAARTFVQSEGIVGVRVYDERGASVFEQWPESGALFAVERRPVVYAGRRVGTVWMGITDRPLVERARSLVGFALLLGLSVVVVSAFGARILLRKRLARPLEHLRRGVSRLAEGNYRVRLEPTRYTDLDAIVGEINEMAEALADRDNRLRAYARHLEGEIEERKSAEEALKRSQEQLQLSQRLEAIGRLAGGVAHDFNNLMMVVITLTELLLQDDLGPQERRWSLEQIRDAGQRAAELTGQLLAIGRRQPAQARRVGLNATIERFAPMLGRVVPENIRIEYDLASDELFVHADPAQLERVLINLVANARDAMPSGGVLFLATSPADSGGVDDWCGRHGLEAESWATLVVKDTGSGMDEETLRRVFDPFFTTKAHGKGTGLGLASVYGIVEQNKGHIGVRSEPGHGSEFRVFLPLDRQPVASQEDVAASAVRRPSSACFRALLVEDNDLVRQVVSTVLRDLGMQVHEESDPVAAVRTFEALDPPPDLLVTDMVMPKMSGPDLATEIRAKAKAHSLRVVFMSGYATDLTALADDETVLQKPFTREALLEAIQAAHPTVGYPQENTLGLRIRG